MSSITKLEWKLVEFREIVEDSAFGPRFSGDFYSENGNIATLRTTDMSEDGRISYENMPLAKLDESRFSKHFLQAGDLVISRSGRIGTTGIFEGFSLPVIPGAFLIRFRLKEGIIPKFYQYFFNSSNGKQLIMSIARGAAQQNITSSNVLNLKVPLPPLKVQVDISEILSNYDDLIENNRRRIQLLEESARLLYREWFVHLRFPGHEHVKIVDGVPEGWEKKLISEVCETVGGGTPSTQKTEYWIDGDIPWVVPTDITRSKSLALLDTEKKITDSGLRNSSAKMVPPYTILMTSRASVGFFALTEKEVCTNQGFINVIPHVEESRMYILHNLMYRVDEIRSHAGGSTYKEINKTRFRALSIIIPTELLLKEFSDASYLIFKQVQALEQQNRKLHQARDLLLPRLMNGEITV